jgi:hypothetical protein
MNQGAPLLISGAFVFTISQAIGRLNSIQREELGGENKQCSRRVRPESEAENSRLVRDEIDSKKQEPYELLHVLLLVKAVPVGVDACGRRGSCSCSVQARDAGEVVRARPKTMPIHGVNMAAGRNL